ncbi:hypothetical protein PV327_010124 [Microctonus hyperodae]|uniref:Uncharacterized protein n=1 Tax=Microctonus hyperodae TaxID=165561 RepID=A0AA39KUQ7_MICHY|nr:hypothetical protein PV327_010124 [Microctonus hyperodae]
MDNSRPDCTESRMETRSGRPEIIMKKGENIFDLVLAAQAFIKDQYTNKDRIHPTPLKRQQRIRMKHMDKKSLFLAARIDSAVLSPRKSLESMTRLLRIEVIQRADGLIIKMSETVSSSRFNYSALS